MFAIRHNNLYVDIATYPNLPASAEKCPLSNSPGMYVTVDSPVFAASVPLQIMRRSWSTLMSCDGRPPLGTDTLVSLTGTPITVLRVAMVLRNIPLWCEKDKTKTTRWILLFNKEIFFYILSYMCNFRPSSKVELFMYWTWSLQLNTWGDQCLNQLSPTYIIQCIKSGTHENFDCGATWFQTSNLLCAKPNALSLQYVFHGKQCTCTPLYIVGHLNQLSNMNGWPE